MEKKVKNEIDTYKESLGDIVTVNLAPLKSLLYLKFDDDESAQNVACIAQVLLERFEYKFAAAFDYITKHHGEIELIRATYRQTEVKPETILGIDFTPPAG